MLFIVRSKSRKRAGENLEFQVFLVVQTIGTALDYADLVVQAFHEAKGDFVFWFAVGGDTVPVPLDHGGKLFEGLQTLPFQLRAPALEELSCPGLAVVVPELAKGFLEHIGGIEALVGSEQELEVLTSGTFEILRMREQRVFLALDERAMLAAQACELVLAHLIERLPEMANDMELVEQNRRLRGVLSGRVAKRLPHVHHRQADPFGGLFAEKPIKLIH